MQDSSTKQVANPQNNENKAKSKSKLWMILTILGCGILILCLISVGIVWLIVRNKDDNGRTTSSTQSTGAVECSSDSDCAVAIRVDECCSCPEVTTKSKLESDYGLMEYFFGKNYSEYLPDNCALVDCAPCPTFGGEAKCNSGKCELGNDGSGTSTTTTAALQSKEVNFSLIGSDQSMYGFTLNFTASIPDDATVDESKSSAQDQMMPSVVISNKAFSLTFWVFYEAYEEPYSSYEKVFNHAELEDVYRVVDQNGGIAYTNQININKNCFDMGTGEDDMPAPCGSAILMLESNVYFMGTCDVPGSDYSSCDDIVQSLDVEVVKL
ncbi:MAG: hypothetical protein ABIE03_06400 [Patescibacteria group bacterium]|nr:hypothetical protein [Patescibacteria group bacterium]